VDYSRRQIVDVLRGSGFPDAADEAMSDPPDPVDLERVAEWGMQRSIKRDMLISGVRGSP